MVCPKLYRFGIPGTSSKPRLVYPKHKRVGTLMASMDDFHFHVQIVLKCNHQGIECYHVFNCYNTFKNCKGV